MERKKPALPPAEVDDRWHELRPLLDQELSRLPDKYRAVLIACDLEGKTRHEAAQELGLPEGTVASRLARARALLSKRLTKHSLAMSTTALVALLSRQTSEAAVPPSLLTSTVKAGAQLAAGHANGHVSGQVAALAESVIRAMTLAKIKIATAVLVGLLLLGIGVSALIPPAQAHRKPDFFKPDAHKMAEKPKGKPELVADCVVQQVDLDKQTLQATPSSMNGAGDGKTVYDLHIGPRTLILIDGKEGQLADLKAGATVNLEIQRRAGSPHLALRIEVTGAELGGVVEGMNDGSVTIESKGLKPKQAFDVDHAVGVLINGKKAKFGDLKPRMKVMLKVSNGRPLVVGINAVGPKFDGAVKAVDPQRQTITLATDEIAVAADAPILIDGKKSRLEDLKAGDRVTVQMSAELDQARVIAITSVRVLGRDE